MSSASNFFRSIQSTEGADKTELVTRLGLIVAYRENILAPVGTPHDSPVSCFESITDKHPALRRHHIALNAKRLDLPSLFDFPIDVLLAACRKTGRREELARCAGLFYALSGLGALIKSDLDALVAHFGQEPVMAALSKKGTAQPPLPTPETIEAIGRYAVRLALSQIPELARWEVLQPVAMPNFPLDRPRLVASVQSATHHLSMNLP